jgi:hypothetical protein
MRQQDNTKKMEYLANLKHMQTAITNQNIILEYDQSRFHQGVLASFQIWSQSGTGIREIL